MIVKYNIVATIVDLTDNSTSTFNKDFEFNITAMDALLYNNYHIMSEGVYVIDMFEAEVNAYCQAKGLERSSVEIDEFEIVSLTDKVDVFFESPDPADTSLSLCPIIKAYVHPKNEPLKVPMLCGKAYDSTTIIWSWPEDEMYAHYLVTEAIDVTTGEHTDKIVAQIPVGATSYTETNLEPDTPYTRRLINYTDEQTSAPSPSCTVNTETAAAKQSLEQYSIPKNYDFTISEEEREMLTERYLAFHSGIGDFNDLKVYKQMDADYYQKFKAYLELTGRRIQREKRYDQVGFNYKICLESLETIEEQEGEVTFDIDVYPREEITLKDYMWVTKPVTVKARLTASVFLRKPVEAQETEETKVYKPKYHVEEAYKIIGWTRKLALVLSIDQSGSMHQARQNVMKESMCALIDAINQKAAEAYAAEGTSMPSDAIQYIIIKWAGTAKLVTNTYDSASAKSAINGLPSQVTDSDYDPAIGHYTCWKAGLNWRAVASPDASREEIGLIFYTDGFLNSIGGDNIAASDYFTGSNFKNACWNSVDQGIAAAACKIFFFFGCNPSAGDPGYTNNGIPKHIDVWGQELQSTMPSKVTAFEALNGKSLEDTEAIKNILLKGLDIFGTEKVRDPENDKYIFDGWEEDSDKNTGVFKYDIDDYRVVTVTSDVYEFTFDENKTPVFYSRPEQRAIIPVESFIEEEKLTTKSIYDIIMDLVKQTPEWNAGFNKTIGTVENNGEPDNFLIKGLHIKDTYEYADEDDVNSQFGRNRWEDGLEGTVNTYTDIDKLGTSTYGDDCYLVSKNNYFLIQGYTDAIIYDYNRFFTAELNGWSNPQVLLISKVPGAYNNLLKNRKLDTLTYDGTGNPNHVVEILEKGDDIYLTRCPGQEWEVGKWYGIGVFIAILMDKTKQQINQAMTADIIAHNDVCWSSPILNYRFNKEDPNAYTPYYEILPDCRPDCEYLCVVLLHVYYARNVYISDENNYVTSFGDDEIATTSSPYICGQFNPAHIPENGEHLYAWTLMEWRDGEYQEDGRYIDEYLWFQSKPHMKTIPYYDELPGPGMDTFYGLVNGRYRTDNQDGMKDLTVDTPQFNIPTTVHKDKIKIYIMITEFYPEDALVSYRWEHPLNGKDSITNVNGDYVYFHSDSVTYKDVEYMDIVQTINMTNQEISGSKNLEKIYEIEKPETIYEYVNYYLKVTTDNSDVLALRYPTEITFDENGRAQVGVTFKPVVNATSQWAPRIHNGYYYLNQHEHFAYAEFDVEADFDTIEEENCKTMAGYVSFDVQLRHVASPREDYSITKDVRAELIQDEERFQWIDGEGLTLKPFIDGEYYKEYIATMYTSPVIMFPNILTQAMPIHVGIQYSDASTEQPMEVRSYDVAKGKWCDWTEFTNHTVPNVPLSCAYQIRFIMQATTWNTDLDLEDYMCCYLDWKDDQDENTLTNIVTITDHMTTGPDDAMGIYNSKIIDFGCVTRVKLDIFESNYKERVKLFISMSDNENRLLLENAEWINISDMPEAEFSGRYMRYRLEIPSGEKVYWLHKRIVTKETHAILPFLKSISMDGVYEPSDIVTNFINTEGFEIPTDGQYHEVFKRIIDIIGADVLERGYTENEIEYVKIQCTVPDISLMYNPDVELQYPSSYALSSSIEAMAPLDLEIIIKNTPYIFSEMTPNGIVIHIIKGTPQQYCPIVIEDEDGRTYRMVHDKDMCLCEHGVDCTCPSDTFIISDETKYVELSTNEYDEDTLEVWLNGTTLDKSFYKIVNHIIIFNNHLTSGDKIEVLYRIKYSFWADIDRTNDKTDIHIYTYKDDMLSVMNGPVEDLGDDKKPNTRKYKVYFETSKRNNKFIARDLSLNPIYRTDYKGFIYLTDDHNDAYTINIYCNPKRLQHGGWDKVDISFEILDILGNPVIARHVAVDCNGGILNCDNYDTDMNGVVHVVYESAYYKTEDKVTAKVILDNGETLENSITIINE